MDRDFIYRQTLVWLEVEKLDQGWPVTPWVKRDQLAESLTNHLVNNFEQIQRARIKQTLKHMEAHGHLNHSHLKRKPAP